MNSTPPPLPHVHLPPFLALAGSTVMKIRCLCELFCPYSPLFVSLSPSAPAQTAAAPHQEGNHPPWRPATEGQGTPPWRPGPLQGPHHRQGRNKASSSSSGKAGLRKYAQVLRHAPVRVRSKKDWGKENFLRRRRIHVGILRRKGNLLWWETWRLKCVCRENGRYLERVKIEWLADTCTERGLFLATTFFQHKNIHQYIWRSWKIKSKRINWLCGSRRKT